MATSSSRPKARSAATLAVARVYMRISTDAQDLARQESLIADAHAAGYYVARVYREKASGARADRPELLRMIADLQPGEVVVAEKIDRISRLPLPEAERLIGQIRAKGARLTPSRAWSTCRKSRQARRVWPGSCLKAVFRSPAPQTLVTGASRRAPQRRLAMSASSSIRT